MFLVLGLILLLVLPSSWNAVAFVVCLALFGGEVAFWNRRVRGHRERVGAATLIGGVATVITACRPNGQVRLRGEIWDARCEHGADPGDEVVVTSRDGLILVVEPRGSTT